MIENLKLGTKLNFLLLLVFVLIVATSGIALSRTLGNYAEHEVASQAFLLIETMSSVREYTSTQVNPELVARLDTEPHFLPQTVPGYSAREVFEALRKREKYKDFIYKEATLNPTNLRDRADPFESNLVQRFQEQSNLKELTGFRSLPDGKIFYVARPLAVSKKSCLRCHSTPEAAPKSQIATYGSENGFGWKLDEIVGAQIISAPASEVLSKAQRLQFLVIGIISVFFLIAIWIINLFLKFSIVRHLKRMAQLSKQVSTGNMAIEFSHHNNDEIGILAASLNRMKISMQMALDMLNSDSN